MNHTFEPTDIVKQLRTDIEKLQAEINREKALREEISTNYEYVKQQYAQAIDYIQRTKHSSSSKDGGCLFIVALLFLLGFLMFYFANMDFEHFRVE